MTTVRVTLFEDPIEVPEDEVEVLRAQGILREDEAPAAAEKPAAKAPATPKGDKS